MAAIAGLLLALATITPAQAQPAVTNPRNLWVLHCTGCHGMDAAGVPDKGVPDMRGMLGRFMHLPEGRAFLVQVPGVNNAGLSDEQIALVTNWMVQRFSADTAPTGWLPYTAAEVAEAKRHRPLDVAGTRAGLVLRLQPDAPAVR